MYVLFKLYRKQKQKNMSFQKCPVCEGSGQVQRFGLSPVCHVCSGHGIIDEVTGQPPVSSVTISSSEDVYISKSPTVAPPNSDDKIKKYCRHVEGGPIPYGSYPTPKDELVEKTHSLLLDSYVKSKGSVTDEAWERLLKKINS